MGTIVRNGIIYQQNDREGVTGKYKIRSDGYPEMGVVCFLFRREIDDRQN